MTLPDPLGMDLAIDAASGDLLIVDGADAALTTGLPALAQETAARFTLWVGEWFLNPVEGLPVLERIVRRGTPLSELAFIFRSALGKIPGVFAVDSLTLVPSRDNTRTLSVQFAARSTRGPFTSVDFPPFVVAL